MVMYIAFPFVAFIGARSASALLGIGLTILAVMMTFVISQHGWIWRDSSWIELSPILRALPSFVVGAALFYHRNIISRVPAPGFLLAVSTVGLVVAMVSGVSQLITLFIVYLVAIAAIAADVQGGPSVIVRRFAPLGQLTYSIYMWHMLFISFLLNGLGDKFTHANRSTAVILVIACYISIFIVSYLSFFFIETPARRWIDKINFRKSSSAPGHSTRESMESKARSTRSCRSA
jgi:peptidoglycan/LPS O-acetylase OafA/YrhL